MKPLVYVAGPYTSHPVHNTRTATLAAVDLWRTGLVTPIIPHLTLLADLVAPLLAEDWYRFDLDQLAHCHVVYRLPGESTGAGAEVAFARERGIPVFEDRELVLAFAELSAPAFTGTPRSEVAVLRQATAKDTTS